MEPEGRIDAGPLIAIPGALLLLISLFIDWYEPGVSAFQVFEVLDLLLAGIALACLIGAAQRLGMAVPGDRALSRAFVALAILAFVIVLTQVINHPPAAQGADPETGLWLGLGGAGLLALGAVLSTTRISLAVNVEGREAARPAAGAPTGQDPRSSPHPSGGPPSRGSESLLRPSGESSARAPDEPETAPLSPPASREEPR